MVLCRLLDRTLSERSRSKLVFLISVPVDAFSKNVRPAPLPSGVGIDDESDQVT